MSVRRFLLPPVIALLVGCSETVGVRSAADQLDSGPHLLQWAGNAAPQFSAIGALRGRGAGTDDVLLGGTPGELSLEQNTASFWSVRGQERSVQINYLSSVGGTHAPFLRFVTRDPAFVPGHGELAQGDSVLITVTVDPVALKVSFQPSGLQFGEPSPLQMSYSGADGDLNGDGLVNASDADIESRLLGIWYREGDGDPWMQVPASRLVEDKSFTTGLEHFSEYAVSW